MQLIAQFCYNVFSQSLVLIIKVFVLETLSDKLEKFAIKKQLTKKKNKANDLIELNMQSERVY